MPVQRGVQRPEPSNLPRSTSSSSPCRPTWPMRRASLCRRLSRPPRTPGAERATRRSPAKPGGGSLGNGIWQGGPPGEHCPRRPSRPAPTSRPRRPHVPNKRRCRTRAAPGTLGAEPLPPPRWRAVPPAERQGRRMRAPGRYGAPLLVGRARPHLVRAGGGVSGLSRRRAESRLAAFPTCGVGGRCRRERPDPRAVPGWAALSLVWQGATGPKAARVRCLPCGPAACNLARQQAAT
jgi:hypothetical protein